MGEVWDLETFQTSRKSLPRKDFYIIIDRLSFDDKSRLTDSIAQAFASSVAYSKESSYGQARVLTTDGWGLRLDERHSCSICEYCFPEIDSSFFSFNSPLGACETCKGFGNLLTLDPKKGDTQPQAEPQ